METNETWTLVDSKGSEYVFPVDDSFALDVIRSQTDLIIQAPCAGKGRCGKCVILNEHRDSKPELACLTIPGPGSRYALPNKGDFQVSSAGLSRPSSLEPLVTRRTITLVPQTRESNPDLQVLLQRAFSLEEPIMPWILNKFFGLYPQGIGTVDGVFWGSKLIDLVLPDQKLAGCVVDIGTTTIALACVDMADGTLLGQSSDLNAQSSWGADVLSRIQSLREGKVTPEALQQALVEQLQGFIQRACPDEYRVVSLVAAGNTAMMHCLFGLNAGLLGESPFLSTARIPMPQLGRELGFNRYPDMLVQGLPSLSAYVGADITAGIVVAQMDRSNKTILLLDIGTNGEMALSYNGKMVSCSTAAGPAFEGAHIYQGMGGIPGAIESVSIQDKTFRCTTIDNQPILGICGSGIIDLMACLLTSGIVDEVGTICPENIEGYSNCKYKDNEQGGELEFSFIDQGTLTFTGKDIREIQLAKAAIAAGIHVLLNTLNISTSDIDEFWIAGGFGGYINSTSAGRIGLYPQELMNKVISAGNTSLQGCYSSLFNRYNFDRMFQVEQNMETIDLASVPEFQDAYVEMMIFPEPDQ